MGKFIDISGLRFGRLTVTKKSQILRHTGALWDCLCDCGSTSVVDSLKLRSGAIVSCGCKRAEGKSNYRHGMANQSRTYKTWKCMRYRCTNPSSTQWKWYGGRGISICERWNDYASFLEDMGERPIGRTIDRINVEKGYSPENCRWATPKEQANNKRKLSGVASAIF